MVYIILCNITSHNLIQTIANYFQEVIRGENCPIVVIRPTLDSRSSNQYQYLQIVTCIFPVFLDSSW